MGEYDIALKCILTRGDGSLLAAPGRVEGQRNLVLSLISELFGPVPEWAKRKIESLGEPELEVISLSFPPDGVASLRA